MDFHKHKFKITGSKVLGEIIVDGVVYKKVKIFLKCLYCPRQREKIEYKNPIMRMNEYKNDNSS